MSVATIETAGFAGGPADGFTMTGEQHWAEAWQTAANPELSDLSAEHVDLADVVRGENERRAPEVVVPAVASLVLKGFSARKMEGVVRTTENEKASPLPRLHGNAPDERVAPILDAEKVKTDAEIITGPFSTLKTDVVKTSAFSRDAVVAAMIAKGKHFDKQTPHHR